MSKNTETSTTTVAPAGPSKKALAAKVIKANNRRKAPLGRMAVVAKMVEKAGLTKAGAMTYYQNFMGKNPKWTL